jgi:hypothetical protein
MEDILNSSASKLADKVSELQRKVKDKNFYPHDIPTEMSLLGALLLGGSKTYDDVSSII